jgi:sugar phosphate isomerase/epimerase
MMGRHNFDRQEEVVREAFRLLGPRIVSAHAKDLKRDSAGVPQELAAGSGELNYELFFELLEKQKPHGFVTLEAVTDDNMREAARFVSEGRASARK